MDKRFSTVLAAALLIAGAASLLLYKFIGGRIQSGPDPVQTRLVVAARNLPVGTLIREPDVKLVPWPGATPKGGSVKLTDTIGRGVISGIVEGEPVVDHRLAPKGAGAGLAATIPSGMRAVAVRVNEIIGVAGFVVPGMRVDVLIAGTPPNAPKELGTLSRTLLQNIEVLSAGQNIQKDAEGKPITVPVVNLLVTPDQAELLNLAASETKIQLVLRNPMDNVIAKTPGTAVSNLFTGAQLRLTNTGAAPARRPRIVKAVAPPPPPKPRPVVVEVFQGGKRDEVKFQETPED
ncbi:MAG TPA: Flp pilus assembly protein CpaB [Bryobacteraceae bacterium]|nr:Flp pilus assembly protein CpaB [Bryobacteraceae bacterium]